MFYLDCRKVERGSPSTQTFIINKEIQYDQNTSRLRELSILSFMSAKLAVSVHYIYILYLYLLNFFLKNRNALISLTRVRVLRSCY